MSNQAQSTAKRPNIFKRIWGKLKAMVSELKKVNWPSFKKTMKATGLVFVVVIFFTLIIFAADLGLIEFMNLLIGIGK